MGTLQEAQLSQRGRACFVFVCSQLQHTYSAEDIFIRFGATYEGDRQTDGHRMPAIAALMHSIARQKPHNNGPLYSNTIMGTLAVDGWAVTFGTARRGLGGLGPRPSPPRCTKRNSLPINGQCTVPISYYLMWHYNCLCTLEG